MGGGECGARVRLKMVVPTEEAARGARKNLKVMVERTRTGAEPYVLVSKGKSFFDILEDIAFREVLLRYDYRMDRVE